MLASAFAGASRPPRGPPSRCPRWLGNPQPFIEATIAAELLLSGHAPAAGAHMRDADTVSPIPASLILCHRRVSLTPATDVIRGLLGSTSSAVKSLLVLVYQQFSRIRHIRKVASESFRKPPLYPTELRARISLLITQCTSLRDVNDVIALSSTRHRRNATWRTAMTMA